jgi:menaquinone-dependent protoporphyrinogen IX oxidase
MKKILVAYTTDSGSTTEIAQAIGEGLQVDQVQIEVRRIEEVTSVEPYAAVVIGAPMIMGWHKRAIQFVQKHQAALSQKPVAYFLTAMSLTETHETQVGSIPVFIDGNLAKPPRDPNHLSFKERYALPANYLGPVLKSAPLVKPVSVAYLGGKLSLFSLNWWKKLFVLIVIQATPGDYRSWPTIKEWAESVRPTLLG